MIQSPDVADAITGILGEDEFNLLKPWLNAIAKDGRQQPVKTYIDSKREEAADLLEAKISLLQELQDRGSGLDDNQKALLERAFLLRGNLASMRGNLDEAREWYRQATQLNTTDPPGTMDVAFP